MATQKVAKTKGRKEPISKDLNATFCDLAERLLTYQECDIKKVIACMRSVIDMADFRDYMEYTGSADGYPFGSSEEHRRKVISGETWAEQEWLITVYRPLSIKSLDGIIELQNHGRALLEWCNKKAAADTPAARREHFAEVMQKIHGRARRPSGPPLLRLREKAEA